MNYFENRLFNPNYMNETYYQQIQMINYNANQNERVLKAVHSFSDMLEQVSGMDESHQEQTFMLCLAELARRNGWR